MTKGRLGLMVFTCCYCMSLSGFIADPTSAAQRKTREQGSTSVIPQSSKLLPESGKKPASGQARNSVAPVVTQRSKEADKEQAKPITRKGHRQINVGKQKLPKAIAQPRTDLKYHGILEDSQRYDPRPNPHTSGVPNPQIPDLTYDHFQELDRNQDGRIDPVEKAFGRLDMDRDLATSQR